MKPQGFLYDALSRKLVEPGSICVFLKQYYRDRQALVSSELFILSPVEGGVEGREQHEAEGHRHCSIHFNTYYQRECVG